MPDYVYVPRVSNEASVFTNGLIAMSKAGIGDYKVGYVADNPIGITMGLYLNNSNLHFVFTSQNAVSGISIYLVSPASTTLFEVTSINVAYEDGYYKDDYYTIVPDETVCTIFSNRQDCLTAMVEPPPSPSSGVVVTAIAYPNGTPPETNGVIVTAIARLSDTNQQGGTSGTGGGAGTFDESSDVVPIPSLPSISAANSGLLTLFRPSLSQLHDLGDYLWTNITDFIENLQKLFSNPMDYFVAFHIVPCSPNVGTARNIKIGLWNTNISMPPVLSQWHTHNCGMVTLPEYWGSALDYAPYTKLTLFLPFIGSVQLDTDEFMGKQINVTYNIDLLSGQCVAMVTTPTLPGQTGSVVYQFTGECSVSVPLTGADWSRVYSAVFGAVGTALTGAVGAASAGVAAGGATAALAGAQAADAVGNIGMAYSLINDTSKGVKGVVAMRDSMQQAANLALDAGRNAAALPAKVSRGVRAAGIANTVNNTVGQVMGAKTMVNHSGSISGSAGMLGVKTPYLLVEYPNQSLANNYKHFAGYPSNIASKLNTLSGYTECEQVIANGLGSCTDGEIGEILESLKSGVYLYFNRITSRGTGITLYSNSASSNTIGKSATAIQSYTGAFREPVSIESPIFTIERNSPIGFNYVYIAEFNRFYYVTGVSVPQHGLVTISCHVDPLESFASIIGNMDAIIRRQENQYNLYLDDGIFKAYQNPKHKILTFPNSFNDYSYILALAGNSE